MKLKIKNPAGSILLPEKDYKWLEALIKKNDKRKHPTQAEKKIITEVKLYDEAVKELLFNEPKPTNQIHTIQRRNKNSKKLRV